MTIQMTVSVIIPTHNRCRLLLCLLDALGAQTYPAEGIEVIVVADGCVDDTVSLVREYTAPYWLKLHEQPARGVSVARNQGAGLAHGELLLFLDDDVIPTPACIAAHVAAHAGQRDRAVIGYYPARLEPDAGYFGVALQGWWERAFQQMEEPGHIWSYRDVMSGNLSLRAGLFQAVGGFHPAFRRHNDQEFGVRLLAAGARLHFSRDALAHHHDGSDLARAVRIKRMEGVADVMLAGEHPEITQTLPFAACPALQRLLDAPLKRLAFGHHRAGDRLERRLISMLGRLESARLRLPWRLCLYAHLRLSYWGGVASRLRTRQALSDLCRGG